MTADLQTTNEMHAQSQYCPFEKLLESERCYRELVESLREIVFRCDEKGWLTLLNQAWTEILGYSKAESLGQSLGDFIHPEDREIGLAAIVPPRSKESVVSFAQPISKKSVVSQELRFYHQNGQIVWLELSGRYSGKDGLSGTLTNITERKQAQEALQRSEAREREKAQQLEQSLHQLQKAQSQLVHTEKMSGLGQLVAGIAHEINNPINFIHGNVAHVHRYTQDLLHLLQLYKLHYPHPVSEIQAEIEAIDLNFLLEDLPKSLSSIRVGTDRIRNIVLGLRSFAHLDEAHMKFVDIHKGINSTLLLLQSRLSAKVGHPGIEIVKEYGDLPLVECYVGQLNQVFMHILSNAIDALEDLKVEGSNQFSNLQPATPSIRIRTLQLSSEWVEIQIADNGMGMTEEVCRRLFDPFFTTKPVGKGMGLGLSISYQIVVEKHGGYLKCVSVPRQGAEFIIQIPIKQRSVEAAYL